MFTKWIKYGTTYSAIEHYDNNHLTFFRLQQKKKTLQPLRSETFFSFDKAIQQIKGIKHLFLIVNNEHVLTKQIDIFHEDQKKVVKQAFPNISINDFYHETLTTKHGSLVAIVRKKTIDNIIDSYSKVGICIIDFSLGNLVVHKLQSFQTYSHLYTSNAKAVFDENQVIAIEKTAIKSENYTINDLEVSNIEILPLAGIIAYYTKNAISLLSVDLGQKYNNKRFFDIGLKAGLSFLLTLLLINFFIFSHYRNQVGTLTNELQMSANFKSQLNTIKNEVTQKRQVIQSMYSASGVSLSKDFDELGFSLPESSLLTEISYQPREGIQKKDKPLFFQENTFIVKGISKNDSDFSNWISAIEQKDWVKEVSILQYGKGKKTGSSSDFEFIITNNDR